MIRYHVFVEGIPKAQPRPRKGKHGKFYNPSTADEWKEAIQIAFMQEKKPMIQGPVFLAINFYFQKKGVKRLLPHIQKPDKDNLEKAVMDALTEAGIWKDDSLVYDSHISKFWSASKTGAEIIVIEEY